MGDSWQSLIQSGQGETVYHQPFLFEINETRPSRAPALPPQELNTNRVAVKTRILTVSTPFWTARCRWVYRNDTWEPVIFDKELNFLKGLTMLEAKAELEKLRAEWQWSPVRDEAVPSKT